MTRILLGAAALVLVAANVREDEKKLSLPQGPQPLQVVARMDRDGNVLVRQIVPVYRQEVREKVEQKDGRAVKVAYTVTVMTQTEVQHKLAGHSVQAFGTDGKKIERKALERLLKNEAIVLLSMDGKKVDPFYLRLVKEGTVVLVGPQAKLVPAPKGELLPPPQPDVKPLPKPIQRKG
jgi:hypothetical protein